MKAVMNGFREIIRKPFAKAKFKKAFLFVDCLILIIALIFCGTKFYNYYSSRKTYNSVRSLYTSTHYMRIDQTAYVSVSQSDSNAGIQYNGNDVIKISEKFQSLLQVNEDTVGWIKIEGTKIDYPVVKYTDNDFYLHNDFEKKKSVAGCIFMDFRNSVLPLDKNTILYGHNLKDASMFRDLVLYKNRDFFFNNDIIAFNTIYEEGLWKVFSAYVTDTGFNYLITDFANEQEFNTYIDVIKSKSMFKKEISINSDDRILTLSTCSYEFRNARMVVHAKLIPEK